MNTRRNALSALLLLGLSAPAVGFQCEIAPISVATVRDTNLDGLGDVIVQPPGGVELGASFEDRFLAFFDWDALPCGGYTNVYLNVRILAADAQNLGPRAFQVMGTYGSTLQDFESLVWPSFGGGSFDPQVDPHLDLRVDVTDFTQHTLGQFGYGAGSFRIEALTNPSGANQISTLDVTLEFENNPCYSGTKVCTGSTLVCPCGNSSFDPGGGCTGGCPPNSGEGCTHSGGVAAELEGLGCTSVSDPGSFSLTVHDAPANRVGLFLRGDLVPGLAVGDGLLCTGGATQRVELVVTDGVGSATTSVDLPAVTGALAGETHYYQFLFRDVGGPCGTGLNLSNGLEVFWDN